ncbi:MAG: DUF5667 domain-containing protein [Patescibacteria group bacterium]
MLRAEFKKLKKVESKYSLTKEEIFAMQKNLRIFQMQNPLPKRKFRINILNLNYKFMIPAIIALAVALSGGVGLAAQNANPGDVLYPVKTSINEPLQTALKIDPEKKAEFVADLVEKRIAEKAKLVEEKKLDNFVNNRLEKNLQTKIAKTETLAKKLSERGNNVASLNVYSRLAGYLEANEMILTKVAEIKPELKTQISGKLSEISEKKEAVRNSTAASEQKMIDAQTTSSSYSETTDTVAPISVMPIPVAKAHLEKTEAYLKAIQGILSEKIEAGSTHSLLSEMSAKFEEAKLLVAEAKRYFDEKKYVESIHSANEAKKLLVQVKVLFYNKVISEPKYKNQAELTQKVEERIKKQTENTKERESKRLENQKEKQAKIEEMKLKKQNKVETEKTQIEAEDNN